MSRCYDIVLCHSYNAAAHGDVTWQRVESNTSCEQPFTPTHVYTASKRDVFIRGNGLLYR